MTEYLDLLERASERGRARGLDRVMRAATDRVRRRRRQSLSVSAAALLAVIGVAGWGVAGDDSTNVAASDPSEFVAFMPDEDRFRVVAADEPRRYADRDNPQHDTAPAGRFGRLTVYQKLDESGRVSQALAIGVVDNSEPQSTLLDMFPLTEGSVAGEAGTYALGSSTGTAGLMIVEHQAATYTVRVAGRGLDVHAVVEGLESIELGRDGSIQDIRLPRTLPTVPVYEGPDASRIGVQPALTTSASYKDRDTGQDLTILTTRDRTLIPATALAWLFDGAVSTTLGHETIIGTYHLGGDHLAYWDLGTLGSVTVISDQPLSIDTISELQQSGQLVGAEAWSDTVHRNSARTTDRITTTTTTTTEP